jgi:hypothetical protein
VADCGFQNDAFQLDAFQNCATACGFQEDSFQNDAFQVCAVGVVAEPDIRLLTLLGVGF